MAQANRAAGYGVATGVVFGPWAVEAEVKNDPAGPRALGGSTNNPKVGGPSPTKLGKAAGKPQGEIGCLVPADSRRKVGQQRQTHMDTRRAHDTYDNTGEITSRDGVLLVCPCPTTPAGPRTSQMTSPLCFTSRRVCT